MFNFEKGGRCIHNSYANECRVCERIRQQETITAENYKRWEYEINEEEK